jgi:hypothetical protein
MARFARSRARYTRYRAAYGGWMGRRGRRTRKGINVGLPFLAGVALGYFAPRVHPLQDVAVTAVAVAPMRLPMNAGNVAKGYVAGMLIKSVLPNIGTLLTGTTTSGNYL